MKLSHRGHWTRRHLPASGIWEVVFLRTCPLGSESGMEMAQLCLDYLLSPSSLSGNLRRSFDSGSKTGTRCFSVMEGGLFCLDLRSEVHILQEDDEPIYREGQQGKFWRTHRALRGEAYAIIISTRNRTDPLPLPTKIGVSLGRP